jgi:hypothetical protein
MIMAATVTEAVIMPMSFRDPHRTVNNSS